MAKQEAERGAKSAAIREWFQKNPQGRNVDCVKELTEKGLEVTPALVANIKNTSKGGSKKSNKGRKPTNNTNGYTQGLNALLALKGVVDEQFAGDFDAARNGLEEAQRLVTEFSAKAKG